MYALALTEALVRNEQSTAPQQPPRRQATSRPNQEPYWLDGQGWVMAI